MAQSKVVLINIGNRGCIWACGCSDWIVGGNLMFKNCVLKPNVNTVEWLKKAGIRAVKTMAQTAVAVIGTGAVISAVDWQMVVSSAVVAGIVSILTSVAGIPEVEGE